jgi:hypothetical protein
MCLKRKLWQMIWHRLVRRDTLTNDMAQTSVKRENSKKLYCINFWSPGNSDKWYGTNFWSTGNSDEWYGTNFCLTGKLWQMIWHKRLVDGKLWQMRWHKLLVDGKLKNILAQTSVVRGKRSQMIWYKFAFNGKSLTWDNTNSCSKTILITCYNLRLSIYCHAAKHKLPSDTNSNNWHDRKCYSTEEILTNKTATHVCWNK